MSFEYYTEKYNLRRVEYDERKVKDFSKYECSIFKNALYVNRAIVDTMGLKVGTFVEFHSSGLGGGVFIIGVKVVSKGTKGAVKVASILKTKPTKIEMGHVLVKHLLSNVSLKDKNDALIEVMDIGEGYLVFMITSFVTKRREEQSVDKPRPKEVKEKKYFGSGITGAQESVLPGSDF